MLSFDPPMPTWKRLISRPTKGSLGLFLILGCSPEQLDETQAPSPDTESSEAFLINGDCQQETISDDFKERSYTTGLTEAIRPDLIGHYIDLDKMLEHVESQVEKINPDTTKHFFKSSIECSLYQLGILNVHLYDEGEFEEVTRTALDSNSPSAYGLAIMLQAGKDGSINCEIVQRYAESLRDMLFELTENQTPSVDQAKLFGQYLLFTEFFRVAPDAELVAQIHAQRFPENQLVIREDFDLQLLYDIDSAARLSLDMNTDRLNEVLAASWTNNSYFHVSDCPDALCQLKTYQLLAFTKAPGFVLDEDKMVAMLGYLLARIQEGTYTHPTDFGVSPELLWDHTKPMTCDYNCTASHWGTTLALNVLLERTQHRETEIRASIEYWQQGIED